MSNPILYQIRIPDGLPRIRDPDSRCDYYTPGEPMALPIEGTPCWGDGHYLCGECVHLDPEGRDNHLYGHWIGVRGVDPRGRTA